VAEQVPSSIRKRLPRAFLGTGYLEAVDAKAMQLDAVQNKTHIDH
jgi:hypothetical protein